MTERRAIVLRARHALDLSFPSFWHFIICCKPRPETREQTLYIMQGDGHPSDLFLVVTRIWTFFLECPTAYVDYSSAFSNMSQGASRWSHSTNLGWELARGHPGILARRPVDNEDNMRWILCLASGRLQSWYMHFELFVSHPHSTYGNAKHTGLNFYARPKCVSDKFHVSSPEHVPTRGTVRKNRRNSVKNHSVLPVFS